jgi:hypothetical protein
MKCRASVTYKHAKYTEEPDLLYEVEAGPSLLFIYKFLLLICIAPSVKESTTWARKLK